MRNLIILVTCLIMLPVFGMSTEAQLVQIERDLDRVSKELTQVKEIQAGTTSEALKQTRKFEAAQGKLKELASDLRLLKDSMETSTHMTESNRGELKVLLEKAARSYYDAYITATEIHKELQSLKEENSRITEYVDQASKNHEYLVGMHTMLEEQIRFDKIIEPSKYKRLGKRALTDLAGEVHGIGLEMARFYTAQAVVESFSCFSTRDPMACDLFLESMKDPVGHIGFAIFMASAKRGTEWTAFLTKNKLPQWMYGNIGMAAGLVISDIFHEFMMIPELKELRKLPWNDNYPTLEAKAKRRKVLSERLRHHFFNSKWASDKLFDFTSLLAASIISHKAPQVAGHVYHQLVGKRVGGTPVQIALKKSGIARAFGTGMKMTMVEGGSALGGLAGHSSEAAIRKIALEQLERIPAAQRPPMTEATIKKYMQLVKSAPKGGVSAVRYAAITGETTVAGSRAFQAAKMARAARGVYSGARAGWTVRFAFQAGRVVGSVTPFGLAVNGLIIFLEAAGFTDAYLAWPLKKIYMENSSYYHKKKLERIMAGVNGLDEVVRPRKGIDEGMYYAKKDEVTKIKRALRRTESLYYKGKLLSEHRDVGQILKTRLPACIERECKDFSFSISVITEDSDVSDDPLGTCDSSDTSFENQYDDNDPYGVSYNDDMIEEPACEEYTEIEYKKHALSKSDLERLVEEVKVLSDLRIGETQTLENGLTLEKIKTETSNVHEFGTSKSIFIPSSVEVIKERPVLLETFKDLSQGIEFLKGFYYNNGSEEVTYTKLQSWRDALGSYAMATKEFIIGVHEEELEEMDFQDIISKLKMCIANEWEYFVYENEIMSVEYMELMLEKLELFNKIKINGKYTQDGLTFLEIHEVVAKFNLLYETSSEARQSMIDLRRHYMAEANSVYYGWSQVLNDLAEGHSKYTRYIEWIGIDGMDPEVWEENKEEWQETNAYKGALEREDMVNRFFCEEAPDFTKDSQMLSYVDAMGIPIPWYTAEFNWEEGRDEDEFKFFKTRRAEVKPFGGIYTDLPYLCEKSISESENNEEFFGERAWYDPIKWYGNITGNEKYINHEPSYADYIECPVSKVERHNQASLLTAIPEKMPYVVCKQYQAEARVQVAKYGYGLRTNINESGKFIREEIRQNWNDIRSEFYKVYSKLRSSIAYRYESRVQRHMLTALTMKRVIKQEEDGEFQALIRIFKHILTEENVKLFDQGKDELIDAMIESIMGTEPLLSDMLQDEEKLTLVKKSIMSMLNEDVIYLDYSIKSFDSLSKNTQANNELTKIYNDFLTDHYIEMKINGDKYDIDDEIVTRLEELKEDYPEFENEDFRYEFAIEIRRSITRYNIDRSDNSNIQRLLDDVYLSLSDEKRLIQSLYEAFVEMHIELTSKGDVSLGNYQYQGGNLIDRVSEGELFANSAILVDGFSFFVSGVSTKKDMVKSFFLKEGSGYDTYCGNYWITQKYFDATGNYKHPYIDTESIEESPNVEYCWKRGQIENIEQEKSYYETRLSQYEGQGIKGEILEEILYLTEGQEEYANQLKEFFGREIGYRETMREPDWNMMYSSDQEWKAAASIYYDFFIK